MTEPTLYDNDAVLKFSAYACWDAIAATSFYPPAVLKVATFSLASQARKAKRVADVEGFQSRLAAFLIACTVIEPTEAEIVQATNLEERATALGEEFDTGESQLVAVLISRMPAWLITGDKRALKALAALGVEDVNGRIICLEQVLRGLVASGGWEELRARICGEREMDKAISAAFACYSNPSQALVLQGLDSYIDRTKAVAGKILAD